MTTRSNEHGEWTDRLSDFLDGELDAARHAEVEAHLSDCGACRRVLEELREVKARAASLGPVEPARDLWGGVAATITAPPAIEGSEDARVIALPTAEGRRSEIEDALGPRRFTLSSRQLVAASVALIAVSSLATWAVGSGSGLGTDGTVSEGASAGAVTPVSRLAAPPADLAEELASLERVLVEARGDLDPNTVRALERNLGVIEQAIEDSRRALAQDPDNDFLTEHLQRVYERKLEFLRDAARVAEQAG